MHEEYKANFHMLYLPLAQVHFLEMFHKKPILPCLLFICVLLNQIPILTKSLRKVQQKHAPVSI